MAVVRTPVEGYEGEVVGVVFVDGQAETDDPAALAYFRRRGYTIDGEGPPAADEPPDPRDIGGGTGIEPVGTKLRDAAVDPRPGDFLAPTNAGHANPHGPEVVAPMIHAAETGPIAPGPVASDPPEQDAVETALAESVFVEGDKVQEATAEAAEDNPTPEGVRDAAVDAPSASASKADWVAFAVAQGADPAEAEASTKAKLREQYGS